MKIWIISDTHWNHGKIVEYENRPKNFEEIISKNWNDKVGETDLVVHLGDVIFSKPSELGDILKNLNGTKILTLGNHDQKRPHWYINKGFALACGYFVFKDIVFSHKPMPIPPNIKYNVHGHFHADDHRRDEYMDQAWYKDNIDRYYLVQIEDSLSPINLEDIYKNIRKKKSV